MRFEGKTAIVTGGSRGIGRACVTRLVTEGATVAFLYNSNKEAAEGLIAELADMPGEAIAYQADVCDGARAKEIVNECFDKWEKIDTLVNSAGIVKDGLLGSMLDEQWHDVINTNLTGVYNYCKAVTQPMLMARTGSIINLSSTAGLCPGKGQVNYAASKGGIDSLTRALAKELAKRNVRVNAVAPGMIETDMSQVVRGLAGKEIKKAIPMTRIGKPEEIAALVTFLASDEASYITGQIIYADGGLTLGSY
jgi:3-oxoacyl-[acyl-carrier protein] reductase